MDGSTVSNNDLRYFYSENFHDISKYGKLVTFMSNTLELANREDSSYALELFGKNLSACLLLLPLGGMVILCTRFFNI